jgi:hypothetical protein
MSVCSPCTQFSPIPLCFQYLHLGTLAVSTNYWFYLKDLTTGRISQSALRTSPTGNANVFLNEQPIEGHSYEFWVTLRTDSINQKARISLADGSTYCCGNVRAESVKDSSWKETNFYSATLSYGEVCS